MNFNEIMAIPAAATRRSALRSKVIEQGWLEHISTAVGVDDPTPAKIRDRLCPEALEFMAWVAEDHTPGGIVVSQLNEALQLPSEHAVDGKFGLHECWVEDVQNNRAKGHDAEEAEAEAEDKDTSVMAPSPSYPAVDEKTARIIDSVLASVDLPGVNTMIDQLRDAELKVTLKEAEMTAKFEAMVAEVKAKAAMTPAPTTVEASGDIPEGKVVIKKAGEVFGLPKGTQFDSLDVPSFEWDGVHPHVPEIDDGYIFRPQELWQALYAIITNQRAYFAGHTGSGKTTLIEQVAARLNWPFMRVNFDSEVTRMDLIGRDVLTQEDGVTVTKFVDGVLPQMLSGPYIGCFDEIDFVRPDVAYVMQRCLEGNGLTLTEDGGRVVKPHPMCRLFATGNTVGQGDEHGMYQGARPQSMALLDRFSVWGRVEYLDSEDRLQLLKAKCPGIGEEDAMMLAKYVEEHIEAFTTAKVLQPISPRGMLALGQAVVHFRQCLPKDAVKQAFEMVVLNRATENDRAVLSAFVDRAVAA